MKKRKHDERFVALMDRHIYVWRLRRAVLNAEPLGCAEWSY